MTVAEATDYPFADSVELKLAMARSVRFPLYLRIPRWCRGAAVRINGQETPLAAEPLSYVRIERQWATGDTVSLRLPMTLGVRTWTKNHDSVSVDYGPLTFSLEIGEKWSRRGGTDKWPAFEVFPTTPWNYGLVLDEKAPASSFKLTRSPGPLAAQPFTPQSVPIRLQAKARRIPRWMLNGKGLIGALQASPAWSDEPIETVTLIPMGAARLRVTRLSDRRAPPRMRTIGSNRPTSGLPPRSARRGRRHRCTLQWQQARQFPRRQDSAFHLVGPPRHGRVGAVRLRARQEGLGGGGLLV